MIMGSQFFLLANILANKKAYLIHLMEFFNKKSYASQDKVLIKNFKNKTHLYLSPAHREVHQTLKLTNLSNYTDIDLRGGYASVIGLQSQNFGQINIKKNAQLGLSKLLREQHDGWT